MPKISEDQRQARRDQILTASWRCCTRRGIQATRMEEIVREANLSAGTPLCRSRTTQRRRYRLSVTLNAGVFAAFVLGAELISTKPVRSVLFFATSVALFVGLLRRESSKIVPLIPLDLLRDTSFRTSVIASLLCFSGVVAGIVALPFQLQHGLGLSTWMTRLYMTPWPLTVAIAAPPLGGWSTESPQRGCVPRVVRFLPPGCRLSRSRHSKVTRSNLCC